MRRTNNNDLFFKEALKGLKFRLEDEDICELDQFGWSDCLPGFVLSTCWDDSSNLYQVELHGRSGTLYSVRARLLRNAANYHFGSIAWVDAATSVEKAILSGFAGQMINREFQDPAKELAYLRLMSGIKTPAVRDLEPKFRRRLDEVEWGYRGLREEADTKLLEKFGI